MAGGHITCDDLELYVIERLSGSDTAPVEEHLLVCQECQARLADFDGYVRAIRAAMHRRSANSQTPKTLGTVFVSAI